MSKSKIAIVTGGSRGIGRDTVHRLAQRGIRTIFTYNANRAEADKVVALADQAGARAIALQLDTGNADRFDKFVTEVRGALRDFKAERFDFLVNNAGTSSSANLETITPAEMDALYSVHFKGVLFLTQKLLPLMNDGGSITFTDGMIAHSPSKGAFVSSAMAGGIEHLTRGLAVELAPLRVNCVCPGLIRTGVWNSIPADQREERLATMTKRQLVPRVGTPAEAAEAYLYLMRGGYTTGQVLYVEGGTALT